MPVFIPTILDRNRSAVESLAKELAPLVTRVHIDFADDTLVPNKTVKPKELSSLPTNLELDAHLMVDDPEQYFSDLSHLGFARVVIHAEVEDITQVLNEAKKLGLVTALALNPDTPIGIITPYCLDIDFVQIMSIVPGFTNQPFLESTYDRIQEIKTLFPDLTVAVDGGVRFHNAEKLLQVGADILIASRSGYEIEGSIERGLKQWNDLVKRM